MHPLGVAILLFVIARHEAISLFGFLAFDNRDRHAPLAMTEYPRDDITVCQCTLWVLRSYYFVIASLRSNLSFGFAYRKKARSPPLLSLQACKSISASCYICDCELFNVSLRACEAISLLSLPDLDNRDCRASLAMTD